MEIKTQKSKVYVLPDSSGYIIRIDGGYTESNITDPENWVLIDYGYGDKYNLCQGNYFPQPIITMGGAYRYKFVDGKPLECTPEEIADQEAALQPEPTPAEPESGMSEDAIWDAMASAYQEGVQSA